MIFRLTSTILALLILLAISAQAGETVRVKPDEPIEQHARYRPDMVWLELDTVRLADIENRLLKVYARGAGFKVEDIVLETVRVHGKIPPYTEARIEGHLLVTDVIVFRFLSAYRPICCGIIEGQYKLTFDLIGGEHIELEDRCVVEILRGDLNLDGYVNENDLNVLEAYLFSGGAVSEFEEMMDINGDGVVDLLDLEALKEIIYGP